MTVTANVCVCFCIFLFFTLVSFSVCCRVAYGYKNISGVKTPDDLKILRRKGGTVERESEHRLFATRNEMSIIEDYFDGCVVLLLLLLLRAAASKFSSYLFVSFRLDGIFSIASTIVCTYVRTTYAFVRLTPTLTCLMMIFPYLLKRKIRFHPIRSNERTNE